MSRLTFILRGLRHYRSAYLGVLLGSALGTMVLLGSLFSGDSVDHTLDTIAQQRTGQTQNILAGGENFFRAALADDLGSTTTPVLQLRGQADTPDGRSSGQVNLFGVRPDFWSFAPSPMSPIALDRDALAINRELARRLDLEVGDSLVIRLRQPSLLSSDAPLSGASDGIITLRGTIKKILADSEMGRFSLAASQIPQPGIFLPLDHLARAIEQPDRANLLLDRSDALTPEALAEHMTLADYGLTTQTVPLSDETEIRSDRVFFSAAMESRLRDALPTAHPVLTYFVNSFIAHDRSAPYSMATGVVPEQVDFIPDDLQADEVVINEWLATDLDASVGDPITLKYYVLRNGSQLDETTHTGTIRAIVPLDGLAADRRWMPDFPGIAEAESSADWSPSMPIDLTRISDKDEAYWDAYRGTPKAFIPYQTARELWQNRWGASTALRLPADTPDLETRILDALDPAAAGYHIRDLAAEAERAATSPTDIATLFLSMSFFLILAALALTAMLFRFNVEQRNAESGLLAALGIAPKHQLRWRLAEGAIVISLGALLGTALAIGYTHGLLALLEKIWNRDEANAQSFIQFHAAPSSILIGLAAMITLSMVAIGLVTRRQAQRTPSLRLTAATEEIVEAKKSRARWLAPAALVLALITLAASPWLGAQGAFFLAGSLLLIAGLAHFAARHRHRQAQPFTLKSLAALNLARRPTRSLVAVGTLAAGVFLVISVTAFQKFGSDSWQDRSSGTGGFALWIETTMPVAPPADADTALLSRDTLTHTVPFRVGVGDSASCFNLNSVALPRLLAADPDALRERFTIKSTLDPYPSDWSALETPNDRPRSAIPAFVDETTLMWALKRKLGDRITYTDESGNTFTIQIVGTLADSVFQGHLIIAESDFLQRFPSTSGYQLFLAESAVEPNAARAALQRDLIDLGATITPTRQRLAAFRSVENAYIGIFNLLGGLGVILGSAGLGLVIARNLHERRDELQMLHTIGIGPKEIRRLIRRESATLIAWATGIGLTAALISIIHILPATNPLPTLGAIVLFTCLILIVSTASATLARRVWLK